MEMEASMRNRVRAAAFARFAGEERPMLLGVAYLMFAHRDRAEDVVLASLARLYAAWSPRTDPRQAVLREVLTSTPARLLSPVRGAERVELSDLHPEPELPSGIVADLAELAADERRAIILACFAALPLAEIAALLQRTELATKALLATAVSALRVRDPVRESPDQLAQQLRAAVRTVRFEADASGAAELTHGRLLVRRRRLRTGLVVAAAIVAVLLGLSQLASPTVPRSDQPTVSAPPTRTPTPTPTPTLTPTPTPTPTPVCDTREASCRAALLGDWGYQMAQLTRSHVDPKAGYFAGYNASPRQLHDSPGFWTGQGGALALTLARPTAGGTEIFLQVATSTSQAMRCGSLTRQPCAPQEFMDGNTFTLTQTIDVRQGLEIQYAPRTDEVITVVARNTSKGTPLDVTRAQLMALVTDERLRLPAH